jgi:hypothetical protein
MSFFSRPRLPSPKWMITYWCPRCQIDSGLTELDAPCCFACERTDGLMEIEREPFTPEAMGRRLTFITDRMVRSLESAQEIAVEEGTLDDEEETMLLQVLAASKDLRDTVREFGNPAPVKKDQKS